MNKKIPLHHGLPPDIWPRMIRVGIGGGIERGEPSVQDGVDRGATFGALGNAIYLPRAFQTRAFTVTSVASQILRAEYVHPYILINPSKSAGLTTTFTVVSGTVTADGNTQATPIGVANYLNAHFHLNVTAIAGTWDIIAQTRDPVTGVWAGVQTIFNNVVAPAANYYASVGQLGVVTDLAVRWVEVVAGSLTFTLSITLKDGVGGDSSGLTQSVYLGSNEGVSLVTGYPLLEGQNLPLVVGEGVELWGIANANVTINIFEF